MKINNKILAILIILIAIFSVSAVSASDEADDVVAIANDAEVVGASHDIAANASLDEIQTTITNSAAGDTINFADNAVYDLGSNDPINIGHSLILQGNNATIKGYNGFLIKSIGGESVAGTQVYNLNFEMTQDIAWKGRALEFRSGQDYIVSNCSFLNGNAQVYINGASGNVTVENNYFKGVGATNASTIGTSSETGTKAINMMGGSGVKIINNIFDGDLLDGVSLARNAANIEMKNNTFSNNWYGVFYGGGITNITASENIFDNERVYAVGIIKAAGNTDMYNNTFIIADDGTAIYVEEGNTAHGYPSKIETIRIYENIFEADNDPDTCTVIGAESKGGMITPAGEFSVFDNIYDEGMDFFVFNDNNTYTMVTDNLITNKNVTIEGNYHMLDSQIILDDETEFKFGDLYKIHLIGDDSVILPNQNVTIEISSGDILVDTINATTDEFGAVEIPLIYDGGDYTIFAYYDGSEGIIYNAAYSTCEQLGEFSLQGLQYVIISNDTTVKSKIGQRFEVLLKDEDGQIAANKTVQFTVNGVTYNRTSDANGVAGLNINLDSGNYEITVACGNVTHTHNLAVEQSMTKIVAEDKEFNQKGNFYSAFLVDENNKPIANQNVVFDINGVKYTKVTDENGEAKLKINLDGGLHYIVLKYEGTGQYASSSAGARITSNY